MSDGSMPNQASNPPTNGAPTIDTPAIDTPAHDAPTSGTALPRRYFGGMRLRFAIAPTGNLVLNAARIALANTLFTRERGARLTLRIDDLNPDRCRPAFAEAIIRDLAALGVTWDGTLRQSERHDRYAAAIEALKQSRRLYPCFESDAELRAKAEQRRKRGHATVYDRAMLFMTAAQRAAAEAGGKVPYWRFRLSDGYVAWRDMILGKRDAKLTAISDPVLVLASGAVAPMLASVVDDLDLGITHVLQAEENAADTGVYLDVMTCLKPLLGAPGAPAEKPAPATARPSPPSRAQPKWAGEVAATGPRLANIPAIGASPADARKLGSQAVRQTLADGVMPAALTAWLTGRDPGAVGPFSLDAMGRTPTPADLLRLNRAVLARTDFAAVADRLPSGATEAFWRAVRADIELLGDAATWWDIVASDIVPAAGRIDARALDTLPAEPWDDTTWETWTAALGPTASPLYQALTGEDHGPPLGPLLPMIGRARVLRRLRAGA